MVSISDVILINHNFKEFKITFNDGIEWQEFSSPIHISDCIESTTRIHFGSVNAVAIRIQILGTQVPNQDKRMTQLLVTEFVGQLNAWPVIKNPTHSTNRRRSKMLSGKSNFIESAGSFSCELNIQVLSDQEDLSTFEAIYASRQGLLFWPGGGDESQFKVLPVGYRRQDFYFVRPSNDYMPEFYKGQYTSGVKIQVKLEECTE
ncbi:hypothetical protein EP01_06785 [Bdellovibrio bacteriovorus]|nr:hypothetical protein EP01_06785 [Bdellovibrio bacteriovorus]